MGVARAGDLAGLAGFVNSSGAVKTASGFHEPRSVWTVYQPSDPTEQATIIAYYVYKKRGTHVPSVDFVDVDGRSIDTCSFEKTVVQEPPHMETLTCRWGGRLPAGGITVRFQDSMDGRRELVAEGFIPAKR